MSDWLQPPEDPPAVRRFGVALVAVVAAAVVASALTTLWGSRLLFLPFFPATMVAAWYGRFAAGVLATALSINALLFLLPAGAFVVREPGDVVAIALFAVVSLLISALCDGLHRLARAGGEAAQRLHTLLRDVPVGLAVVDRDLRFVYINDALVRINDAPRDAHLGRRVTEVLKPDVAMRVAGFMREALRTGEPIVNRVVAGDDEAVRGARATLASYSPVRGPEGAVEQVAVAVMDITEQQQLAEALARSGARLQALAQASIRITSTVSIDQPLDDTLSLIADLVRDVTGAAAGQIITDVEEPRPGKGGDRSLAVPVMGRDGKQLGALRLGRGNLQDPFSPEDRAVAVQFAQMASAAIENHRLHQRIVEADRRKDEFLAMLGHELRNPLAAVQSALSAASRDRTHRDRAIEIAQRQSQQLARLVDDLLDVARITQGRITLKQELVPVATIARRAVDAARAEAEARRHVLETSRIDESATVLADPARLEQVVVNLLANAVRYTDPGGRIDVIVERGGAEALVRVRDSGHGIEPGMLERIFEVFAQAKRPLDRSQGGLGIGLSVARRLVELHGGRIEAHSAGLGQGSEFVVRLPALPAAPVDARPSDGRATAAASARILIVEDNEDAAQALAMLLEVLGHEVHVVHDAEEALAASRGVVFDVMLIDIGLPGMDGYELAERLRARPEMAHTTLVALTGYGRREDRQRALAAGFDQHLVKPVEPEALEGLVARLVEAPGSPRTLH